MEKPLLTIKLDYSTRAEVQVYADDEFNESDYDTEDGKRYKEALEDGKMIHVHLIVKVWDKTGNIHGTDALGGCLVYTKDLGTNVRDLVKDYDMLAVASEELNETLYEIVKEYKNQWEIES